MAEIRTTLYSKELQKQIFPNSDFYKKSIGETGVADNVETVEKPVQTKIGKAKEGFPTSLPLKVEVSTDTKKTYSVTKLYCAPLLVDNDSQLMVNYNKRETKQAQQAGELNLKAANYAFLKWCPSIAANIVKSTGSARATNVVGLTSTRKALTKADLLAIHNMMMRMNVSGLPGKWYGLLTADAYTDLLTIPEFVDYEKTGNSSKLEQGVIGKLMGIEFMTRSTDEGHAGGLYNAAGTVAYGADATIANDMLPVNLFWNDQMVCRAEGAVRTIVNQDAPGYLGGTIIESFTRFGADIVRDDQKGVIALLEANS